MLFFILTELTKIVQTMKNDNVALFRPQRIFYDKDNPRIELTIYPVEYIGIFDNDDDKMKFEDKCKTCKRYARNCSLLRKAIEGRIQSEIKDCVCKKYSEIKN